MRHDDGLEIPALDEAVTRIFILAGGGRRHVEYLGDKRALRALVALRRDVAGLIKVSCDIVGGDPPCLLAGPASGIIVLLLSMKSSTSTTSPTA